MATTKAISANAYKNNHGTAQNVGTSSTMASEASVDATAFKKSIYSLLVTRRLPIL